MLKMWGLCFLFLGCLIFGLTKSANLHKRLELLEELRRVLMLLSGEIRYIHSPLPEAFRRVGQKAAEPFGTFFKAVADDMEGDEKKPLWELFQKERRRFQGTALQKEDIELLLELGKQMGYLDITMQLRTLELYGTMLEEVIQKAAGDYSGKARMYRYLGVLGGLFLVVLLA